MSEHQDEPITNADQGGRGNDVEDGAGAAGQQVIGDGVTRLVVSASPQDESEPVEPKKIAIQPRSVPAATTAPTVVDSPVHDITRLERDGHPGKERVKLEKVTFEKLVDRPDEDEIQEAQWGQSMGSRWKMMMMGGSLVIVLVVCLVTLRGMWDGDRVDEEKTPVVLGLDKKDDSLNDVEKWFRDRSGSINTEALQVLTSFIEAPDNQARSQWVRRPEAFLRLAPEGGFDVLPRLVNEDDLTWQIDHTGNIGYLTMNGKNTQFFPFRAYFVRVGDELKLDWQASAPWSEATLKELRSVALKRVGATNQKERHAGVVPSSELSPSAKSPLPDKVYSKSVLIRCMMRRKEEYYAGAYNDQDHSAYLLLSPDMMHDMWAYVPRGSELDLKLKAVLDHGSFVVSLKVNKRVVVRVKVNEKVALPSQLELVELVTPEWITPN